MEGSGSICNSYGNLDPRKLSVYSLSLEDQRSQYYTSNMVCPQAFLLAKFKQQQLPCLSYRPCKAYVHKKLRRGISTFKILQNFSAVVLETTSLWLPANLLNPFGHKCQQAVVRPRDLYTVTSLFLLPFCVYSCDPGSG